MNTTKPPPEDKGLDNAYANSLNAAIWVRCAKKPLPQKGAYYRVRDRIAERGFDKAGRQMAAFSRW